MPEGWTSPEIPLVHDLPLEDLLQNLAPGMLHQSFSAALNTEEKVKDRSISEDEDDEVSQKKVSAAQYQLFRQAVTSSKGTFKVNPSLGLPGRL